jgi:exonuclease III
LYKTYRDDVPEFKTSIPQAPGPSAKAHGYTSLLAWNANGFNNKATILASLAQQVTAGVIVIGEHRRTNLKYEPKLEGYRTYSHPAEPGFYGLCMMVRNDIGSYEKPTKDPRIQHLVVTHLEPDSLWHIFGVYLQSGSNKGQRRTTQLKPVWEEINNLLDEDPNCKIAIGGDFNMPSDKLAKAALRQTGGRMTIKPCCGSNFTRLPKKGKFNDIDHWMISPALQEITCKTKVSRQMSLKYNGASDHAAISMKIRKQFNNPPPPSLKWDLKTLKGHGTDILTDEAWKTFPKTGTLEEKSLQWTSNLVESASKWGAVKYAKPPRAVHFPRKIANLLKNARKTKALYQEALGKKTPLHELTKLTNYAEKAGRLAKTAIKKFEKEQFKQKAEKTNKHLTDNEMLDFHAAIKAALPDHIGKKQSHPMPCKNKEGKLCVTNKDIAKAEFEHFSTLSHNTTGVSQDPSFWEHLTCDDPAIKELPIGGEITPQDFLAACSRLNKNAARGNDNVPPVIFKEILKLERSQFIGSHPPKSKDEKTKQKRPTLSVLEYENPEKGKVKSLIQRNEEDKYTAWEWGDKPLS